MSSFGLDSNQSHWQEISDGVRADFSNHQVEIFSDGTWQDAILTKTELAVFRILVERSGRPVGRNQIIDFVERERDSEDEDETMTERSFEMHISRLRPKLARAVGDPVSIRAVQGIRYRLVTLNQERP